MGASRLAEAQGRCRRARSRRALPEQSATIGVFAREGAALCGPRHYCVVLPVPTRYLRASQCAPGDAGREVERRRQAPSTPGPMDIKPCRSISVLRTAGIGATLSLLDA